MCFIYGKVEGNLLFSHVLFCIENSKFALQILAQTQHKKHCSAVGIWGLRADTFDNLV